MSADAGLHRRGYADRLMNAGEIVVHEMEGDSRLMVVELPRESVGEAREPANLHPNREVLAFDIARRDMFRVWTPGDCLLTGTRALRWAVTTLGGGVGPAVALVEFYKHGVVNIVPERAFDGLEIDLRAVGRELDTRSKAVGQVADKGSCRGSVAPSNSPS